MARYDVPICPECKHRHDPIRAYEATRTDPGYLDGDPPDQCEECGCTPAEWEWETADADELYDGPDRVEDLDY